MSSAHDDVCMCDICLKRGWHGASSDYEMIDLGPVETVQISGTTNIKSSDFPSRYIMIVDIESCAMNQPSDPMKAQPIFFKTYRKPWYSYYAEVVLWAFCKLFRIKPEDDIIFHDKENKP